MKNTRSAGSVRGLHLIVDDIEVARAQLLEREVNASEFFHFVERRQAPGLEPRRASYGTFCSFGDPDGNQWLVQEVRRG